MSTKRKLPDSVVSYAKSPVFTSQNTPAHLLSNHEIATGSLTSVPDKLLNIHDLKAGVWARINVELGCVEYFLVDQDSPLASVKADEKLVILPEEKHYIKVSDDAIFQIEFFREPR